MGEHLTPSEARLYLERGVSVIERDWIDSHLVRCGNCAALCVRLGGYGTPRSAEEVRNQVAGRRAR